MLPNKNAKHNVLACIVMRFDPSIVVNFVPFKRLSMRRFIDSLVNMSKKTTPPY